MLLVLCAILLQAAACLRVPNGLVAPVSPRASRVCCSATNDDAQQSPSANIVAQQSPFAGQGGSSTSAASTLDFTVANVNKVLDEVRPYLIADGGNVEVLGVQEADMSVQLELQGACGSCPSSTVTMKQGIERVLREKWPTIGEVINVGGDPDSTPQVLTVETAYGALESIMPAIAGLGGSVRVVSAGEVGKPNTVVLDYNGPAKVKFGIELALKDSPLIDTVEFV